jgi:transcription elongation factor SPT6
VIHLRKQGPYYLTLTLKVCDGVYAHKDIVEEGKYLWDLTTFLRLGNTLSIGEETFEYIDEVCPMQNYIGLGSCL